MAGRVMDRRDRGLQAGSVIAMATQPLDPCSCLPAITATVVETGRASQPPYQDDRDDSDGSDVITHVYTR